jgi:hypothetical protein
MGNDGRVAKPGLEPELIARPTWPSLPTGAKAFRLAHVAAGVVNLTALGYVWVAALTRRRDVALLVSMAVLSAEGAALVIGRGNCPFGPLQTRLGDPVPMFELFLPPRAAKAAVPVLSVVTLAGFAAALARSSSKGPARGRGTQELW